MKAKKVKKIKKAAKAKATGPVKKKTASKPKAKSAVRPKTKAKPSKKKAAAVKPEIKIEKKEKIDLPEAVVKAIQSLDARKAVDIKVYNVSGLTALWDYFIICGATSSVHGGALRDSLKKDMAALGMPISREDRGRESSWHIVDFGDMLVHIFEAQSRAYYSLEEVWGGREVNIKNILI